MLKLSCDLCDMDMGPLEANEPSDRDQVKVTLGRKNLFIGDLCPTCLGRLKIFLNLPKE